MPTPAVTVHLSRWAQSPSPAQLVLHPVGAAVLHPYGVQLTFIGCVQLPAAHMAAG